MYVTFFILLISVLGLRERERRRERKVNCMHWLCLWFSCNAIVSNIYKQVWYECARMYVYVCTFYKFSVCSACMFSLCGVCVCLCMELRILYMST